MEETIKPIRTSRSNRNSGIFQDLRQQAEAMVQTPPRANTMPMGFPEQALGTPGFMNMANVSAEFVKIESGFDSLSNSFHADLSSTQTPMTPHMVGFAANPFENKPEFRVHPEYDSQQTIMPNGHGCDSPSRRGSPHRRTESLASIASAASIADINIEETKTDTGVTMDDIAMYIEGPDPADGKWVCTYDKCDKRFGRKENIKSHVQTHLNDRQYQCPSCKKCFVRQHDLKRHAKIHTGIKPYPCECGNSFARHDALTRHRQRGMCIGAFDGVVRKVVKRGRPRKNRPDMDERLEKSERTRRKNKHASTSSVSSFSGYSDSSAVNSPAPHTTSFDGMMDDDNDPFPDIMDVAMSSHHLPVTTATMNPSSLSVSSAPMPSSELVDITSPDHRVESPSAMSHHSFASHPELTQADLLAEYNLPDQSENQPPSPGPTTPPELSASSSPPQTGHSARLFDIEPPGSSDPNSSTLSESSIGLLSNHHPSMSGAQSLVMGNGSGAIAGLDDSDMSLLQFPADEDVLFNPSGSMGLHHGMGKPFDDLEEYDAAVSLFTNGDDVFFGSS